MNIIFSPLSKAFSSLKIAVARSEQNPKDLEIRDGCIQRFEYTYELSIKTIKRFIKEEHSLVYNVNELNYRDLIRLAAEIGLIEEIEPWFQFREARNQTSHAYDDIKAIEVFNTVKIFIPHVENLIATLNNKIK